MDPTWTGTITARADDLCKSLRVSEARGIAIHETVPASPELGRAEALAMARAAQPPRLLPKVRNDHD